MAGAPDVERIRHRPDCTTRTARGQILGPSDLSTGKVGPTKGIANSLRHFNSARNENKELASGREGGRLRHRQVRSGVQGGRVYRTAKIGLVAALLGAGGQGRDQRRIDARSEIKEVAPRYPIVGFYPGRDGKEGNDQGWTPQE
eukprot:16427329-Heterocapsa_arctica.AAC.1